MNRLFGSFHFGLIRYGGPAVIDTIGHQRPAIICAFFDNIDLVPTPWAVLMYPDLPGLRMPGHPLWIPVAIGKNGRPGAGAVYKRVVRRDPSVVVQAVYFSAVPANILWVYIPFSTFPYGKIQISIPVKFNTGTKVLPPGRSSRFQDSQGVIQDPSAHPARGCRFQAGCLWSSFARP